MPQAAQPQNSDGPTTLEQWDEWDLNTLFRCEGFNARLTKYGCVANQCAGLRAWNMLAEGVPFGIVENSDLDRLFVCGPCPVSALDEVDLAILKDILRRELDSVAQRLQNMNWDRFDSEVSDIKKKKRAAEYRKKNKEWRREYMRVWRYKTKGSIPDDM